MHLPKERTSEEMEKAAMHRKKSCAPWGFSGMSLGLHMEGSIGGLTTEKEKNDWLQPMIVPILLGFFFFFHIS